VWNFLNKIIIKMIEEFQIKEIKIFADFSNCAVGEVLKVFKQDNSSDLELLIESRSNNHLNFYKTCKPFSCNTFFQEKGDKNPLKKISEVCYLSQDYLNMGGHELILSIDDKDDKRRELYHKYFELLSEKRLI